MTRHALFHAAFVSIALLAAPAAASEAPIDQEAIAYRKEIMKTLEAQFNALAGIIAFDGPADNLKSHLETVLITARMVLPSFEKRAPGGTSQPYLWDDWAGYTRHMQEFEAAVAMAIEAAKHNSLNQVIWYTDQISCRKCHDAYKQKGVSGGVEYLGY
ncbi:MAG: cytochrome c [Proteobacteria bacterium]|nr:cytochrome c [Pseudomonadota bacterium]MCA0200042.1 cytochrome c [Pseudomonadota bacterium]